MIEEFEVAEHFAYSVIAYGLLLCGLVGLVVLVGIWWL